MSQRSFFLVAVLLLLLVGGVAATLAALVRREPAWYAAAAVPPGPERLANSDAFRTEFSAMYNSLGKEAEPQIRLTDTQINSFFEEEFLAMHYDHQFSSENISQPRVAFDQDHLKIGFRYGHGLWSSIVTVNLRIWVPDQEPNAIALELESFRAGALPITAQSLLEEIAEIGRKNNLDVNWYRLHNHPVALVRFQPDQPRPTFQLTAVQLKDHSLTVQWRTIDSNATKPLPATP
jgi:hypothetical protein